MKDLSTIETMKSKGSSSAAPAKKQKAHKQLSSRYTDMTSASNVTGVTLSAKSSMSASFLSASQFRSLLFVSKLAAVVLVMWVMYKLMSVVQKNVQPQNKSVPQIMMMGGKPSIELSLDFDEFSE
jgi:hypothetical protein